MRRKVIDTLLFLIVTAGCVALTLLLANGNYRSSTTIYNFAFLGIMVILYLIALGSGLFRMADMADYFGRAADKIDEQTKDRTEDGVEARVKELGFYRPLQRNLNRFLQDYRRSQSGICDIEDYINEDEADSLVHKRMLDMVPDLLTSLGILGTFVGLVWGLRAFQPSNYEAMTASVTSLVDGIKVAFLTSIYGLILSLVCSYSSRTGYTSMSDELHYFLERFHTRLVPSAEMEAQNRLVNSQAEQNELLRSLTSEFSDQVAHGFAANMAPTLDKINTQLGSMMTSISNNQQMFLQDIVDSFVKEMKVSFHKEFNRFGETLDRMNETTNRNIAFTEKNYQQLTDNLRGVFTQDEASMHASVAELTAIQKEITGNIRQLGRQVEEITATYQKAQDATMKNLAKSEQESSRFWVACNQAMQNYLKAASGAYDRFEEANTASDKVLRAITATYQKNEKLLEETRRQMDEFQATQNAMNQSLEEIRRLFYQMEVAGGDGNQMYIYPGVSRQSREQEQRMLKQMENMIQKSEERQNKTMEEILGGIDDLNDKTEKRSRWFGR